MSFLNLKYFINNIYLNNYYFFIKQNLILKWFLNISSYFNSKLNVKILDYDLFYLSYNLFIFYDYNELINNKNITTYFYCKFNN